MGSAQLHTSILYFVLIKFIVCTVEPPNPKEAVKWLYLASFQGHVRAQYQLAICLYQGRGADRNMKEAEHLSCEHFGAFLANVKELNAREQRKEVHAHFVRILAITCLHFVMECLVAEKIYDFEKKGPFSVNGCFALLRS